MAYFPTTAKTAPPSTKHGWPVPVDETGIVWTCHRIFPETCDGCSNKYHPDTAPDGDAGLIAHYCTLEAITEDEGSDLGGQDPGLLLAHIRKLQRLLSYFWWLGAGYPAADSNYEGESYTFFTERWNLYVSANGNGQTITLSRTEDGYPDPLQLPQKYVGASPTAYGPIQLGDEIRSMGTGGSVDPNGASGVVCAITGVGASSVSVRLTRPIYVANGTAVAAYGNRAQPQYLPYPVPATHDTPLLCGNCRVDPTDSMQEIADGLSISNGVGTFAGETWYCAQLLDASRIEDFEPGECSITTCSRYVAATNWPPVPVVAWNALLAGQNMCRVIPLAGGYEAAYFTRPSYGAPSLAGLLGDRAFDDYSLTLIYPQVTWYGGLWGRVASYEVRQGVFRPDNTGALYTGTHRECPSGGLQADATMQDLVHRSETENQPTRRWPSLGCSSLDNLPGLWSGYYGWTSPSEFAAQTVRKREQVFPGMERSDTAGQGSFGTWVFHADAGKTLTGYKSKLTVSVDAGRTFPTKQLSTTARTIAAVTEDSGNGVLRIELTPETVTLPYQTLDEYGQPTVDYLTFMYAGNAVDPPDHYRIRCPFAGDSRNKTGDLYDKIQRGDTVRFSGDEDYAFTVLRAEAMFGSAVSYSDTLLVDDVPIPGIPYLITATVDAMMTATQTHVEIETDGGLPPAGYIGIGAETVYYAGKAQGYGGTLLTGLVRGVGATSHAAGTSVIWNYTGDRKKRDCIWVQWHGELGASQMSLPQANDTITVNTSSRHAPTKCWSDDGAGTTAWDDTGYTLALRHREVDGATDETLTESVDYLIDRAGGTIEVFDSAVGIDNTALDGGIDDSQTTITVDDAAGFPANGRIQIDDETISYTGQSATTFNGCTRGVVGAAASHSDGAIVRLADPAARTLSGDIDEDDTTIALDSDDGVPDYGLVQIDSEVVGYSGLSGNQLTNCRRGAKGTTAASHTNGADVTVLQPWDQTGQCLVVDCYAFDRSQYTGTSAGDIQAESLTNLAAAVQRIDGCFAPPTYDTVTLQASVSVDPIAITGDVASWWTAALADAGTVTMTVSGISLSMYKIGTLLQYYNQVPAGDVVWYLGFDYFCDVRGLKLSGLGAWGRFPTALLAGAWVDVRIVDGAVWNGIGYPDGYDLGTSPNLSLQAVILNGDSELVGGAPLGAGATLADGDWHRVSILPLLSALSAYQYSEGYSVVLTVAGSGSVEEDMSGGLKDTASAWIKALNWTWAGGKVDPWTSFDVESEYIHFDGDIQARNWRVQIDWDAINNGTCEIPEVVHWPGNWPAVVE